MQKIQKQDKGFTLLELLIVIAILAVLATIVVLVLNPAETLAKSRDTQRMSDLATLKSAIALYTTTVSSPTLGGAGANTSCKSATGWESGDSIYYSYPSDAPGADITDTVLSGGTGDVPSAVQVTNANLTKTDNAGWIPVNFGAIVGGSPISNLPVDPTNTIASVSGVADTDLVYRYACYSTTGILSFEIDANLESGAYTATTGAEVQNNKEQRDGGNNTDLLEVGTKLDIMSTGL